MQEATAEQGGTEFKRAPRMASWDQRCSTLFEDLRKPARVLIGRAYGSAFSPDEIDDVYSNAWTSSLAALRGRAQRMGDDELRSYVLTAVANHASKEIRRRSRKPTSALEENHARTLADAHAPAPEESAVTAELGAATRDVLSSLPPRRRAVILLRYGWGLEPKEVCALIDGLSPRAYRKEITRGVEEVIGRLAEVESGSWCDSREPILREFVAGTCSEDARRQALQHIGHCRGCAELVARLQGHLHELGGAVAWTSVAGAFDQGQISLGERALGVVDRARESVQQAVERITDSGASEVAGGVASAGGARGAGAAGAGALAKLAGLGAAGKAAVACLGASAAAGVCVAAGVGPLAVVGVDGKGEAPPGGSERPAVERQQESEPASADPQLVETAPPVESSGADGPGAGQQEKAVRAEDGQGQAEAQAQATPAPEPEKLEFGLAPQTAAADGGESVSGGGAAGAGSDPGSPNGAAGEFAGP